MFFPSSQQGPEGCDVGLDLAWGGEEVGQAKKDVKVALILLDVGWLGFKGNHLFWWIYSTKVEVFRFCVFFHFCDFNSPLDEEDLYQNGCIEESCYNNAVLMVLPSIDWRTVNMFFQMLDKLEYFCWMVLSIVHYSIMHRKNYQRICFDTILSPYMFQLKYSCLPNVYEKGKL